MSLLLDCVGHHVLICSATLCQKLTKAPLSPSVEYSLKSPAFTILQVGSLLSLSAQKCYYNIYGFTDMTGINLPMPPQQKRGSTIDANYLNCKLYEYLDGWELRSIHLRCFMDFPMPPSEHMQRPSTL
ncbi:unnamed protein product [Trichogramma brassicae]|uniref:Uncharacterized protein n=1 Tax=Trichogramma brassicae TaxID=86971 RepID=A0A6H5I4W7_9HYME|nr:unnamed protein product [Trichogramma brassicae]